MSLAGRTGRRRAPWFDDERAASAEELGREVRALKLADDVGRTASWQASSGMVVEPLDPQGMEQRLPDLLAAAGFFRRAEASNVEVGARARLPARVHGCRRACDPSGRRGLGSGRQPLSAALRLAGRVATSRTWTGRGFRRPGLR